MRLSKTFKQTSWSCFIVSCRKSSNSHLSSTNMVVLRVPMEGIAGLFGLTSETSQAVALSTHVTVIGSVSLFYCQIVMFRARKIVLEGWTYITTCVSLSHLTYIIYPTLYLSMSDHFDNEKNRILWVMYWFLATIGPSLQSIWIHRVGGIQIRVFLKFIQYQENMTWSNYD